MGGLRLYMRWSTETLSEMSAKENVTIADFFLSPYYGYQLILYICYLQLITFALNLIKAFLPTIFYNPPYSIYFFLSIVYNVYIIMSESALQGYAGVLALK